MSINFKQFSFPTIKFACFVSILTLLSLFLISLNSNAQTTAERGLILSPAIMELEADRGNSYEFTVKLENDSRNNDLDIRSLVSTFEASSEEGIPAIKELPIGSELRNWVRFETEEFSLKAAESFDSSFTVSIPESAQPGSYFLAITYSTTEGQPSQSESTVEIEKRVAALLFITVKGQVERVVEFKQFESNRGIYDPLFDGIKFDYKISTAGNVYLKPAGNIFVTNSRGVAQNTFLINPNDKFILPNSSRSFDFVNHPKFKIPLISNKVSGERQVDFSRPFIGSRKIKGTILYANSEGQLERKETELNIMFVPWKSGITLAILMVTGISAYFLLKKPKQSNNKS